MRKIHFGYLKEEKSKEVLDYLVDNCPDKLKIFALDANADVGVYGSAEYYIEGIKKVNIIYEVLICETLTLFAFYLLK